MNELLRKTIVSGLGLASLAQDAVRETVKDLVKQSKLTEEEGQRVLQAAEHRSKQAQKTLEKKVDQVVRKAVKQLQAEPSARHGRGAKANGKAGTHRRRQTGMRTARAQ